MQVGPNKKPRGLRRPKIKNMPKTPKEQALIKSVKSIFGSFSNFSEIPEFFSHAAVKVRYIFVAIFRIKYLGRFFKKIKKGKKFKKIKKSKKSNKF